MTTKLDPGAKTPLRRPSDPPSLVKRIRELVDATKRRASEVMVVPAQRDDDTEVWL